MTQTALLSSHTQEKRLDIQFLRALSFLLVFVFHLYPKSYPSGFIGVDVFFVVSGFVITLSISKANYLLSLKELLEFFRRRFNRLVPALSACVLLTLFITIFIIPSSPLKDYLQIILTGLSSLFGLSNIFLSRQALDYFGDITHLNPFLQTWSLSVEFQFYFLFALVLFIWQRICKARRYRFLPLTLLFIYSFSRYFMLGFPAAYFDSLSRFWEILAGVFTAQLYLSRKTYYSFRFNTTIWGASLLLLPILSFFQPNNFLIPSAVFLASLLCLFPSTATFLFLPTPQLIGKYSYTLYLLHWPIICFLAWTIRPSRLIALFLSSILLIAITPVFYTLFESKQAPNLFKIKKPRSFLLPSAVCASLASIILPYIPFYPYLGTQIDNDVDELAWSIPSFKFPPIDSTNSNLILFGNSHARHLLPVLSKYASSYNINLFYNEAKTLQPQQELEFINYLTGKLHSFSPQDTLVISSAFFSENDSVKLTSRLQYNSILTAWQKLLRSYTNSPSQPLPKILFVINSPRFQGVMPYHVLCSTERFRPSPPECSLDTLESNFSHSDVISILTQASRTNSQVSLLNLKDFFCDPDCTTYLSGNLLFRDSSHLTRYGSLLLFDTIKKSLQ